MRIGSGVVTVKLNVSSFDGVSPFEQIANLNTVNVTGAGRTLGEAECPFVQIGMLRTPAEDQLRSSSLPGHSYKEVS